LSKNIIIYSNTEQIANPKIAIQNGYNSIMVRIVWQSLINNHWQILSREYLSDSLTNIISLTDSTMDNITPALSSDFMAWIRNGSLLYKSLDSLNAVPIILDSVGCSNPVISMVDYSNEGIAYEKGLNGSKQIYQAAYVYKSWSSKNEGWSINKISNGIDDINPCFGYSMPSYQEFKNGVWKIVFYLYEQYDIYDTTDNISYNCENPEVFAYIPFSKISTPTTPYFVVYDSDSLKLNKQVIIRFPGENSTFNLSNAEGDNYLPQVGLLSYPGGDSVYSLVLWTHEQNGKKDIWMSLIKYFPGFGAVNDPAAGSNNFKLMQNYPNPFNPSTTINYQLPMISYVTLKVYDILGREVKTLINGIQQAGTHSVIFNAAGLSSGVYFYRLNSANFVQTKKLIVIK
jgi:hypothetical protein